MNRERMTDAIETERLLLFPYPQENLALFNRDLPAFEERYGVTYRGEELDEQLTGFLKQLEREIADDPEHYLFFTEFLLVRKEDDTVIGSIDYKYVPRSGVTEVGYGLNPDYEGQGYMTEALRAFLDFGRSLGIRTVRADTRKDNLRSQRVLRKCGFRFLREDENLWWEVDLTEPVLLTISRFEELDARKLMDVYGESNEENIDYFFPGAEDRGEALKKVEAGFLDFLRNDFFTKPGNTLRVLEADGLWLSAVRLYPIRDGLYYLEALETHPAYRRQGCAARLLRALIRELEARGSFRLCDCVGAGNLPSRLTHERCGFQVVSEPGFDYLRGEDDEGTVGMAFICEKKSLSETVSACQSAPGSL